jgi:hypothetical protein
LSRRLPWPGEEKEEEKEAFEGDYMDYRITWIEAYISFLIHVIS